MYIILYGIIFHEYHYIRISVLTDPFEIPNEINFIVVELLFLKSIVIFLTKSWLRIEYVYRTLHPQRINVVD